MLCDYIQRFHENKWSENEKWDPNHVGDVRISLKWGRIHGDVIKRMLDTSFKSPKEATCNKKTYICNVFLRSSLGGMGRIEGERSERQSDKTETYHQHGLYLGRFGVEKVR